VYSDQAVTESVMVAVKKCLSRARLQLQMKKDLSDKQTSRLAWFVCAVEEKTRQVLSRLTVPVYLCS